MTDCGRSLDVGDHATIDIDPDEDPHFEKYDGALVEVVETYNHVASVLRVIDRDASRMDRRLTGPPLTIVYEDLRPVTKSDNATTDIDA